MTEKATEMARENGEYRCESCGQVIRLTVGHIIPKCPHCGFDTYDLRNRRYEQS